MPGKQIVSQNVCICSGSSLLPNTGMRGKKNCMPIFDRVQFQEEEFEKAVTHFGS